MSDVTLGVTLTAKDQASAAFQAAGKEARAYGDAVAEAQRKQIQADRDALKLANERRRIDATLNTADTRIAGLLGGQGDTAAADAYRRAQLTRELGGERGRLSGIITNDRASDEQRKAAADRLVAVERAYAAEIARVGQDRIKQQEDIASAAKKTTSELDRQRQVMKESAKAFEDIQRIGRFFVYAEAGITGATVAVDLFRAGLAAAKGNANDLGAAVDRVRAAMQNLPLAGQAFNFGEKISEGLMRAGAFVGGRGSRGAEALAQTQEEADAPRREAAQLAIAQAAARKKKAEEVGGRQVDDILGEMRQATQSLTDLDKAVWRERDRFRQRDLQLQDQYNAAMRDGALAVARDIETGRQQLAKQSEAQILKIREDANRAFWASVEDEIEQHDKRRKEEIDRTNEERRGQVKESADIQHQFVQTVIEQEAKSLERNNQPEAAAKVRSEAAIREIANRFDGQIQEFRRKADEARKQGLADDADRLNKNALILERTRNAEIAGERDRLSDSLSGMGRRGFALNQNPTAFLGADFSYGEFMGGNRKRNRADDGQPQKLKADKVADEQLDVLKESRDLIKRFLDGGSVLRLFEPAGGGG